jgi:N-acetylglucosaminyldiphosphoundecaprenol N-acetyl-beta-D-mannosaminyltransferase
MGVDAMSARAIKRINLLGLPMDKLSLDEVLDVIEEFIASGVPHQIVVLNAAKVIKAMADRELRDIILSADLVNPDGVPLVWVSKLLRSPLPGRVNGTDLMERLVELASRKGYRVYFFGARQEVVEKVVDIYRKEYPALEVAGFRNGYFAPNEEFNIVEKICSSKPDILLVAMGTPMKEKWVKRNLHKLNVPVCHGVGGSFDVVAGLVKRAPIWMQRAGLEWLYRIYQEPRRMWKRYLVTNAMFVLLVILELGKLLILQERTRGKTVRR